MNDAPNTQPDPCMPCGGSGEVVSKLGGEPRKVPCPWCHGTGLRIPEADAQQWRTEQDAGQGG